jgi:hypothetical protein
VGEKRGYFPRLFGIPFQGRVAAREHGRHRTPNKTREQLVQLERCQERYEVTGSKQSGAASRRRMSTPDFWTLSVGATPSPAKRCCSLLAGCAKRNLPVPVRTAGYPVWRSWIA